jgi:hypothetical protein
MNRRNHLSRRLGYEPLENRLLMAGNVTVSVSGGDLVVSGDNSGNQIQIVQAMQNGQPVAGRFYVSGQNNTRINGQTTGQYFSNVTDDFTINLRGGNDTVTLGNGVWTFVAPDDVDIDTGTGAEADIVHLNRILVLDDISIKTGGGKDMVTVKAQLGSFSNQDGTDHNLSIETGDETDTVYVTETLLPGDLSINTGSDNIGDRVDLVLTDVGDDISINTGGGDDVVNLTDVWAMDDVQIYTSSGRDTVKISASDSDELFTDLGSGIDRLELTNTRGRRADLRGGSDADTLLASGNTFSESYQTNSF